MLEVINNWVLAKCTYLTRNHVCIPTIAAKRNEDIIIFAEAKNARQNCRFLEETFSAYAHNNNSEKEEPRDVLGPIGTLQEREEGSEVCYLQKQEVEVWRTQARRQRLLRSGIHGCHVEAWESICVPRVEVGSGAECRGHTSSKHPIIVRHGDHDQHPAI